jgi:hypothetical protein
MSENKHENPEVMHATYYGSSPPCKRFHSYDVDAVEGIPRKIQMQLEVDRKK